MLVITCRSKWIICAGSRQISGLHPLEYSFPTFAYNPPLRWSSSHHPMQPLLISNCLPPFAECEGFVRVYTQFQALPK